MKVTSEIGSISSKKRTRVCFLITRTIQRALLPELSKDLGLDIKTTHSKEKVISFILLK